MTVRRWAVLPGLVRHTEQTRRSKQHDQAKSNQAKEDHQTEQ
jgi:hypothetical protein